MSTADWLLLTGTFVSLVLGLIGAIPALRSMRAQQSRTEAETISIQGKTLSDAFTEIDELRTENKTQRKLIDDLTDERDKCRTEIAQLRINYGNDVERLNGEIEKLNKELHGLENKTSP